MPVPPNEPLPIMVWEGSPRSLCPVVPCGRRRAGVAIPRREQPLRHSCLPVSGVGDARQRVCSRQRHACGRGDGIAQGVSVARSAQHRAREPQHHAAGAWGCGPCGTLPRNVVAKCQILWDHRRAMALGLVGRGSASRAAARIGFFLLGSPFLGG